ncbi:carbon storage regulator [Flavonifractor sp. An306]|uniref:carbon storage regulator n=1 Tax=Flavonifractor sp. An306 TaxID=1965629 RepID=UPI000B37DFB0|nr:carbon storage regulator [Flavonifractor sp. An306]OUO37131.1 carbon storage regulator [Flavonifractor sp. An306]
MLKLSLSPEEYLTINGNIVVQLNRINGGRAYLSVNAAREIPIVRGRVLEREGAPRPACLESSPRRRATPRRNQTFRWNDERDRAAQAMEQTIQQLEAQGQHDMARKLRIQLDHIIPAPWEEDLSVRKTRATP